LRDQRGTEEAERDQGWNEATLRLRSQRQPEASAKNRQLVGVHDAWRSEVQTEWRAVHNPQEQCAAMRTTLQVRGQEHPLKVGELDRSTSISN
jgi:hypothetical protein